MSHRSILSALAVTAAALVAGPAQALVLTPNGAVSCTASLVTDDTTLNPTYDDCAGAFDGNNKGNATTVGNVLDTIASEFGLTIQSIFDVSGQAGTSGAFDLSGIDGAFVLALKAGDAFSLYAFTDGELIQWDTLGVGFLTPSGNLQVGQNLSHATVYTTAVIPEPETYALMMAGLAVVGWVSRRRQRRQ